jgi:hypothetical protein
MIVLTIYFTVYFCQLFLVIFFCKPEPWTTERRIDDICMSLLLGVVWPLLVFLYVSYLLMKVLANIRKPEE